MGRNQATLGEGQWGLVAAGSSWGVLSSEGTFSLEFVSVILFCTLKTLTLSFLSPPGPTVTSDLQLHLSPPPALRRQVQLPCWGTGGPRLMLSGPEKQGQAFRPQQDSSLASLLQHLETCALPCIGLQPHRQCG